MSLTYEFSLYLHIIIGFVSLVLFWIPVFAAKGSALHARAGHWYTNAMYGVGISAFILSLMLMIDPIGFKFAEHTFNADDTNKVIAENRSVGLFLLAISVLVLVNVRHGLQAVKAKANPALMRRPDNLVVNFVLLAIGIWLGVTATGGSPLSVLFYIFAGICSVTAVNNLRFCFKSIPTRGEQIIAHLSNLIGAGIASHTAFFVFGASRALAEVLTGYLAIIPWVLPGVVGTALILVQARKYRPRKARKFMTSQTS